MELHYNNMYYSLLNSELDKIQKENNSNWFILSNYVELFYEGEIETMDFEKLFLKIITALHTTNSRLSVVTNDIVPFEEMYESYTDILNTEQTKYKIISGIHMHTKSEIFRLLFHLNHFKLNKIKTNMSQVIFNKMLSSGLQCYKIYLLIFYDILIKYMKYHKVYQYTLVDDVLVKISESYVKALKKEKQENAFNLKDFETMMYLLKKYK